MDFYLNSQSKKSSNHELYHDRPKWQSTHSMVHEEIYFHVCTTRTLLSRSQMTDLVTFTISITMGPSYSIHTNTNIMPIEEIEIIKTQNKPRK